MHSHQVKGAYDDLKCKQATCVCSPRCLQTPIRPSWRCIQSQDLSEKTTWCHSCIQFCRWPHYCPRAVCAAVSKEATTMVTAQTIRAVSDVVCVDIVVLQTIPFPDSMFVMWLNGSTTVKVIYGKGRPDNMPVLSGVGSRRPFRSFTMFRVTLCNTSISYSHDNRLIQ